LWPVLLESVVAEGAELTLLSVDATHLKAHQDACRHGSPPETQGLGKTKGGRNTKINAVVDAAGKLVRMRLMPGNEHEVTNAVELLGRELHGSVILADKGYQSMALAVHIFEAGGIPNIPSREGTKNPLPYHKELGRFRRVVENFFCRIKRSRRVATRYEKLAVTFTSFVILAALDDRIRF